LKIAAHLVTPPIRLLFSLLCRLDVDELRGVPRRGPLIIVLNHVSFLEVPILYSRLYPRDSIGLAKQETWDHPLLALLARAWDAIPLDRQHTDLAAMRRAFEVLKAGKLLLLAPEGTRSGHGRLQKGHAGIIQIALKSGAPVIPIAHTGGERFWRNLKRLRRTPFTVRVGPAFTLRPPRDAAGNPLPVTREIRQEMTDAVMNRIALLLPAAQRGAYPEPEKADYRTLDILQGDA